MTTVLLLALVPMFTTAIIFWVGGRLGRGPIKNTEVEAPVVPLAPVDDAVPEFIDEAKTAA